MKKGNFPDGFDLNMRPVRDFVEKLDSMFQHSFRHLNDHFQQRQFQVQMKETEQSYIILAELPGYSREQINLEIIGNRLKIAVNEFRSTESIDNKNQTYQKQQALHQMERVVTIPFIIPQRETKAIFVNGLLTVTIPKNNTDRKFIHIE